MDAVLHAASVSCQTEWERRMEVEFVVCQVVVLVELGGKLSDLRVLERGRLLEAGDEVGVV